MQRKTEALDVSVVVPLFNEEGNVAFLSQMIDRTMVELASRFRGYEIVLVDDGSNDQTWRAIEEVCNLHSHVRGLRLARNFGHQNALLAGLKNTSGNVIITMDGDLQHPPKMLPALVEKWCEGYDVVNTERRDEGESSQFKKSTSYWFYRIFSRLTAVNLHEGNSDFRLLDRKVLDALLSFDDVRMFFRGAVSWVGFNATTIPYELAPRHSGSTKYTVKRMMKFAGNAVISFSSIPLRMGIALGFITSFIAFLELLWVVYLFTTGVTVPGWASTIGVLSLLFGILFILVGMLGLYVSRIHETLQGRPRFIIMDATKGDINRDK